MNAPARANPEAAAVTEVTFGGSEEAAQAGPMRLRHRQVGGMIIGVVLVAATAGMSNGVRTAAAALPDVAFVGMGVALLRRHSRATSCR